MSELRTISITLGDAPPFSSVVFAGFGTEKSLSFAKFSLSELPDTMGADFIDYLIGDPFIIPPRHQKHYAEKIVYLPNCYQPNDLTRPRLPAPTREDCRLSENGFVFCCFNQTYKITPLIFDLWCRLLSVVPGSVLWLLVSNPYSEKALKSEATVRG